MCAYPGVCLCTQQVSSSMFVLGEFPLLRVLFILSSVLYGQRESETGLVCCPAFVRCMWFCTVCGQKISQFPGRGVSGAGETGSLLTNGGLSILLKQQGRIQLQSRYAWGKLAVINALYNLVGEDE